MRIEIHTTYDRVFKFAELSENAKEKVITIYLNDDFKILTDYEELEEEFDIRFKHTFPESSEYSIIQWENSENLINPPLYDENKRREFEADFEELAEVNNWEFLEDGTWY